MLSTSADILNLILAACALILTFFLALAIYYFIFSVQKIHRLIKRIEGGVTKAEEVVSLVRDKVKSGSAYLMIMAEIVKQALEFTKNKDWGKEKEKIKSNQKRKK